MALRIGVSGAGEAVSLEPIQYYTPGLLGWAIATSATIGAAATLQGWRQTKLIRRLQLSPVSTRTVVGATFVGAGVADLLHSATIAVVGEVPIERLWHAVPSYPTLSEVWLRLLEALGRDTA